MAFGADIAGFARVAFEATGVEDVIADTQRVEHAYRGSLSDMSDAAIKLQLAEDRLQRAMARGPANYRAIANAELGVRRARAELRRETEGLTVAMDRQGRVASALRSRAGGLSAGLAGLRGSVGALGIGMIGSAGLAYAFRQTLAAASDLEEEISKARVTFGESAAEVEAFARATARSIGIARADALAYASTLGGILRASGLTREEAARLGVQFVQLGGDMASFNNASPAETLEAIRAGLVGEYEPLRRYQVLLGEARVAQEALRESGKRSKAELTEREKVLARVNLILRGTVDQQGDAARTGRDYAGQVRRLNAQLRDLQTSLGTVVLPLFTDFVALLNDGVGAANSFAAELDRLGNVKIPGTELRLRTLLRELFVRRDLIGGEDEDEEKPSRPDAAGPGLGIARAIEAEERRRARRARGSRRTLADILLDEARAEATTPSVADDLRFKRERRDRIQAQIERLEARKRKTAKQKAELAALYGDLRAVEAEIDALIEDQEAAAAERRLEAERKREEAERKAAERLERLREAAARRAEERLKLFAQGKTGRHGWNRQGMRAAALAGVEDMRKAMQERRERGGPRDDERRLLLDELRRMQVEFLQELQGIMNQFGSNVRLDAGPLATHAHVQTELLRDQNRRLEMLTRSVQHSGARYARTELAAAFGGVGGL
jgi:hypothetical protein